MSAKIKAIDLPDRTATINVAARVPVTAAEGPGARYAIWVQGCPLRCPGCCNPHFLEFAEAQVLPVDEVYADIIARGDQIEGVTFIGGEPFSQAAALAELATKIRAAGLSVMVFSGFELGELQADEENHPLLAATDLLVDGPYVRELHPDSRRWIGSTNQRVHFLTQRYKHLDENWDSGPNTIELRLSGGQLTINGFPHQSITRLARKRT